MEQDQEKKSGSSDMDFYADTMEMEKKHDDITFMNKQKSVFADSVFDGINKGRSVFDTTAVFHTGIK